MSLEGKISEIEECLQCHKNKLFSKQIGSLCEKYNRIIQIEIEKLPEKEINQIKIAYCRGALDQLQDILSLPVRAKILLETAIKGKQAKVSRAKKFESKQKGRM